MVTRLAVSTPSPNQRSRPSALDVEVAASRIAQVLDMRPDERTTRLARLRARVSLWTAAEWLTAQLAELGCEAGGPADAERVPAANTT